MVTSPAGVPPALGLTLIVSRSDCSWPNWTVAVLLARAADATGDSTDTMACRPVEVAMVPPVTQFPADQQDTTLCGLNIPWFAGPGSLAALPQVPLTSSVVNACPLPFASV